MAQDVIQAFQLKYGKRQLQHLINQMDLCQSKTGTDLLKEISILDAMYWISGSWNEVDCSTITKCFSNCRFKSVSTDSGDDDDNDAGNADNYPLALQSLARQLFDCDFQELINIMVTCSDETQDWERPATELLLGKSGVKSIQGMTMRRKVTLWQNQLSVQLMIVFSMLKKSKILPLITAKVLFYNHLCIWMTC